MGYLDALRHTQSWPAVPHPPVGPAGEGPGAGAGSKSSEAEALEAEASKAESSEVEASEAEARMAPELEQRHANEAANASRPAPPCAREPYEENEENEESPRGGAAGTKAVAVRAYEENEENEESPPACPRCATLDRQAGEVLDQLAASPALPPALRSLSREKLGVLIRWVIVSLSNPRPAWPPPPPPPRGRARPSLAGAIVALGGVPVGSGSDLDAGEEEEGVNG